jgi:hypothetical protein
MGRRKRGNSRLSGRSYGRLVRVHNFKRGGPMKKVNWISLIAVGIIFAPQSALLHASGETGAQFLKIGVGAKACAMGGAFVSVADDASAIYWNPAGISQLTSPEVLGSQNFWLMDMSMQFVGAVIPLRQGSLGLGVAYSSSGDIPRVEDLQVIGSYSAYDAAISVAYANRFRGGLRLGLAMKIIQQKIYEENAKGMAVDLGLLYQVRRIEGLHFGLSVQNLGPGMKFIEESDPLPMMIKAGASYRVGSLLLASSLAKPRGNDARLNVGGELSIKDTLFAWGGYNSLYSYSLGVGMKFWKASIGYAFVPYKEIEDSHRISVTMRF